jgi:nucleoside-triphosphatase THEP1
VTTREPLAPLSPGDLLARVFPPSQAGPQPESSAPWQILLSGPRRCGKSTWCRQLAQAARDAGLPVYGLLSLTGEVGGRRGWIDLIDLHRGDQVRLATHRRARPIPPGASPGPRTASWQFDPRSLEWGCTRLEALSSLPSTSLFIMDELGPLEFERGLGFVHAMTLFDPPQSLLSVAVIRPELLALAQARWPAARPMHLPPRPAPSEAA